MTNEEKYKLLCFQMVRNDVLPNYTQTMSLEHAKRISEQVAIATISKFPEIVDFEKLKADYDEALREVKKTYLKDGAIFTEFPEIKKPDGRRRR